MAKNSAIEWTHHTFNPWIGCQKVGPGCDHCYAEVSTASRALGVKWGPHAERRRTSPAYWRQPLKWNADAKASGQPVRVFCASLADWADNAVDPVWRLDMGDLIAATPYLTWMLLTKRTNNILAMLSQMFPDGVPPNVWIGVTVVNQEEAERARVKLKFLKTRREIKRVFLSIEPMLGPIDLSGFEGWLDWVIVGGESGHHARPMHPAWPRVIRDWCETHDIAFFFKQWGEFEADEIGPEDPRSMDYPPGHVVFRRVGKKAAGNKLGGRQYLNWPEAA